MASASSGPARRAPRWALALALALAAAQAFADPALDSDPHHQINQLLDAAFNAYVDQDYSKALSNFQRVLQIDPKDTTALRGIKQCRKKMEHKQDVKTHTVEKSLKLVRSLAKDEKWLDAIDLLNQTIQRAPNELEALQLQNEIGARIRQRLLMLPFSSPEHQVYQGYIFYFNRRYDDAAKAFREAAALLPNHAEIFVFADRAEQLSKEGKRYEVVVLGKSKAKAAFDSGNYGEAAQLWKQVLEYDPQDEDALKNLPAAQELASKRNKETLIGDHYDRGLALFNQGKYAEALGEWQGILAIDPNNEVAKDYAARIAKKGVTVPAAAPADEKPAPAAAPSANAGDNAAASAPAATPEPAGNPAQAPQPPAPAGENPPPSPVGESAATAAAPVPAAAVPAPKAPVPAAPVPAPSAPAPLPPADLDKGIRLLKKENYPAAIDYFEKQAGKRPQDAQVQDWLLKAKRQQAEKAKELYNRGLIAYSQGKVGDAVKEWKAALKVLPGYEASERALKRVKEEP